MSSGAWKRCLITGIPMSLLSRADDRYLSTDGNFEPAKMPDCNIFDSRSFAAICGFDDHRHFVAKVLKHPDCSIHFHQTGSFDISH